jgi:hypothetical protein
MKIDGKHFESGEDPASMSIDNRRRAIAIARIMPPDEFGDDSSSGDREPRPPFSPSDAGAIALAPPEQINPTVREQ